MMKDMSHYSIMVRDVTRCATIHDNSYELPSVSVNPDGMYTNTVDGQGKSRICYRTIFFSET